MANLYVAEATVTARLGGRATALLDRDEDGSADSGLLAALIEDIGRTINMRLRQRYGSSVPFAQITATPATPEEIQKIALDLVLFEIYAFWEPDGRDALYHFKRADGALTGLLDGTFDIDVARAGASEGKVIAVYSAATPVFGGYDSDSVNRTKNI